MFSKILIANRGDCLPRGSHCQKIRRTYRLQVYSDADRFAKHVSVCDEAIYRRFCAQRQLLALGAHLEAAKQTGAQAIHPGYGF